MGYDFPKIRLYVPGAYAQGIVLAVTQGQAHYLAHVMRCRPGDAIAVFNGEDGVWLAEIAGLGKKQAELLVKNRLLEHMPSPDLWLAFAPIKNKTEQVVEKATELGVSRIIPTFMQHSVVTRVNMDKLAAHVIEAAEQCERHDVPAIEEKPNLQSLLAAWPAGRLLLYGDESGGGQPMEAVLDTLDGPCGLLVGPEGGFSKEEHRMLKAAPFVRPFGMGPRILKADTAAVAAIACVMARKGDWNRKPHFEADA